MDNMDISQWNTLKYFINKSERQASELAEI